MTTIAINIQEWNYCFSQGTSVLFILNLKFKIIWKNSSSTEETLISLVSTIEPRHAVSSRCYGKGNKNPLCKSSASLLSRNASAVPLCFAATLFSSLFPVDGSCFRGIAPDNEANLEDLFSFPKKKKKKKKIKTREFQGTCKKHPNRWPFFIRARNIITGWK